jgi:hypothetical protein
MSRNIAAKSLKSATTGEPPTFTKEEMAYLTKKALDESSFSEVKVITPDPTITLKKGNTEISVKNAAAVVRKMEEKYPNGMTKDSKEDILRQPFIKASLEHGIKEMENTFVAPVSIVPQHTETKSVNKNAYELRHLILENSIGVVNKYGTSKLLDDAVDDVIKVCKKFYSFVENKK